MKYIDSEKLIAEIENEIKRASKKIKSGKNDEISTHYRGEVTALFTIKCLIDSLQQKQSDNWNDEYREDELLTRFAFYTYKDEYDALYLSNVFVEETSRNKGFGTKILAAAEKVAETIGAINIRLKVKQNSPANAWYRKHGYGYMAFEGDYDWLEKTLEYLKPKCEQPGSGYSEKPNNLLSEKQEQPDFDDVDPKHLVHSHYTKVRETKTGRVFWAEYSSEAAEWYEAGTGKAYSISEVEIVKEQPEANLEKEVVLEWEKCEPTDEGMGLESANIVNEQFDYIARHFYELGFNARKEE